MYACEISWAYLSVDIDVAYKRMNFNLRRGENNKNGIVFAIKADYEVQQEWSEALSSTVVQSDFDYQYVTLDTLGVGGFGKVSRIKSKVNGVCYAGKFVSKRSLAEKPRRLELLKNEIDVIRDLEHPNIVPYYATFETASYIVIVMEFIDGKPILDLSSKEIIRASNRIHLMA